MNTVVKVKLTYHYKRAIALTEMALYKFCVITITNQLQRMAKKEL